MKIKNNYLRYAVFYQRLAQTLDDTLDFSREALEACYEWESRGKRIDGSRNGFVIGKGQLNLMITMWKEDIAKGLLNLEELYADPSVPDWILDKSLRIAG